MGWEYRVFFRRSGGSTRTNEQVGTTKKSTTILDQLNAEYHLFRHVQHESPRTDLYLSHSANVGIKYRDVDENPVTLPGHLEVKCRVSCEEDSGFEKWKKHIVSSRNTDAELEQVLQKYGLHEINPPDTPTHQDECRKTISIHKNRRWGGTRNGMSVVEETELVVSQHPGFDASRETASNASMMTEHWTTVSVEGPSSQDCVRVKDVVLQACRDHAAPGVIYQCGYPEFVSNVVFCNRAENASQV